jgi:hypothetical protein
MLIIIFFPPLKTQITQVHLGLTGNDGEVRTCVPCSSFPSPPPSLPPSLWQADTPRSSSLPPSLPPSLR